MIRRAIDSPIGQLLLVGTPDALCELHLPPNAAEVSDAAASPALDETERQLAEYFAGERQEFDVPLEMDGTDFQREVWRQLVAIPYGETCSYVDLAREIGRPKASRAVGQANGRNPIAIIVPCHRVIAADGTLGGYGGGLPLKQRLLDHEGWSGQPKLL